MATGNSDNEDRRSIHAGHWIESRRDNNKSKERCPLTSPVHGPYSDSHLDVGVVQAGLPHAGSLPGRRSATQASERRGRRSR